LWDEENRLGAADINDYVSSYTYDAGGERVTKLSGGGQGFFVNSVFAGGKTSTSDFTLYVNPYLVAQNGGRYTKHIYIGSQKIVSKLGDFDSYGADPRRVEKAGESFSGVKVDYEAKYKKALEVVKANYTAFEVPYYGNDNNDYVNGLGFCCNPSGETSTSSSTAKSVKNDNAELQQFYYHPDHLGSSSYISNLDGEVVQHIEYVPFGEVFLEEKNAKWNTPYLFTSKELDNETGLYYFGARYQDPKLGIFISVDPLANSNPSFSPYHYCSNNPINRTDPTGMCDDPNCTHGALRRGWDSLGRGLGLWGHSDNSKNFIKQNIPVTVGPIEEVGPMLSQDNSTREQRIENEAKYNEQQFAINTVNNSGNLGSPFTQLSVAQGVAYGMADVAGGEVVGKVFQGGKFLLSLGKTSKVVVSPYSKILSSLGEFDPMKTLYRGTSGSEAGASGIFLTDDISVARTYINNGGKVMQYDISTSGLYNLEHTKQLFFGRGINSGFNTISTEYQFIGKELVKEINNLGKPFIP
jgi:RHS repeat-associated protein